MYRVCCWYEIGLNYKILLYFLPLYSGKIMMTKKFVFLTLCGLAHFASADWLEAEQRRTQMLQNRVRQIEAVQQLRQTHDNSYAQRYTSTIPKHMYECTQQYGVAECTEMQISAMVNDPNFQGFSPQRQQLIWHYNQERFIPYMNAVTQNCDLNSLNRMERALRLAVTHSLPHCSTSSQNTRRDTQFSNKFCQQFADIASYGFLGSSSGLQYQTAQRMAFNNMKFNQSFTPKMAESALKYGWQKGERNPHLNPNSFKKLAYAECQAQNR